MILKRTGLALLALAWSVSLLADAGDPRKPMPMGNPGEWVTSDDYPGVAISLGLSGA